MFESADEPRAQGAAEDDRAASRLAELGLAFVIILFGSVGWWLHLRPEAEADPGSIARIQLELGDWRGVDIPMEDSVEAILRADAHVQRAYTGARDELVWLYVGYYGTKRGGRPEHTPWVCYPSAGWDFERQSRQPLSVASGPIDGAELNEVIIERDGFRRLVHFWYTTHRSVGIATENGLTLDHVFGRLSPDARADGALVRLSTPITGAGLAPARSRLRSFASELVPALQANWPARITN